MGVSAPGGSTRGVSALGGVCSWGEGGVWCRPPPGRPLLRAVRILLEYILVLIYSFEVFSTAIVFLS